MSVNLTVPKDGGLGGVAGLGIRDRPRTPRRAKSPNNRGISADATSSRAAAAAHNPRAKSKSPNPSFCSVLSRVKDWELGAFTPKTALAENVDVCHRTNSNSSNDSDLKNRASYVCNDDLEPWKPSPSGSPDRGVPDGSGRASEMLSKSTLSSNIGELTTYIIDIDRFNENFYVGGGDGIRTHDRKCHSHFPSHPRWVRIRSMYVPLFTAIDPLSQPLSHSG